MAKSLIQAVFTPAAWQDDMLWQTQEKKTLQRINQFIEATLHEPFTGVGMPEALRENLRGFWSRRIDEANRLVYVVEVELIVMLAADTTIDVRRFRDGCRARFIAPRQIRANER
jgi:toxin YoeB